MATYPQENLPYSGRDPQKEVSSREDISIARKAFKKLAQGLSNKNEGTYHVILKSLEDDIDIEIPVESMKILAKSLFEKSRGNDCELYHQEKKLTTQKAADLLNVSRPFVIKLIDEGKLSCHMAGSHRRILFSDVMRFKETFEKQSNSAMDELAKQAQELDLGY